MICQKSSTSKVGDEHVRIPYTLPTLVYDLPTHHMWNAIYIHLR